MILSFKETFVPAVADGTKPHSIRAGNRWREGMSIQFYKNARQKSMAKIREDGVALGVQSIELRHRIPQRGDPLLSIVVDGRELKAIECATLAHSDGFDSAREMRLWFEKTHGLPFTGQLIHWTDLRY